MSPAPSPPVPACSTMIWVHPFTTHNSPRYWEQPGGRAAGPVRAGAPAAAADAWAAAAADAWAAAARVSAGGSSDAAKGPHALRQSSQFNNN